MSPLVVYASQAGYVDHLARIVERLPDARLVVNGPGEERAKTLGLPYERGVPRRPEGPPVLVCGYQDARATSSARRLALLEHGAGQAYSDVYHQGYPGGPDWRLASLILTPGPHAAEQWRRAYPYLRVEEIGVPKLDRWWLGGVVHGAIDRPVGADTAVAFTFHWKCRQTTETWPAFDDWRGPIADYRVSTTNRMMGHWHPRWGDELAKWWHRIDVEAVPDFSTVLDEADVLVADNTSCLYEFAATGRPVVCLNSSRWRKDVEHGLRFWSHVPGVSLDPGADLGEGIERALLRAPEDERLREAAVARVYGDLLDGHATDRACALLADWA